MGEQFDISPSQKSAIGWDGNKELLISAAAGSGKTFVLIRRIIDRIVNKKIPIDEFLIVTFTEATASELKAKITKRLEEEIDKDPKNDWLKTQLANVSRAWIGTIDSFCLKLIKENHDHKAILLPKNVRILQAEKGAMLLDEAIDEVFTDEYERPNNTEFTELLDTFASFRNDSAVKELVRKLFYQAINHPNIYEWIEKSVPKSDNTELKNAILPLYVKIANDAADYCDKVVEDYRCEGKPDVIREEYVKLCSKQLREYARYVSEGEFKKATESLDSIFDINLSGGSTKEKNTLAYKNAIKFARDGVAAKICFEYENFNGNTRALTELARVTSLCARRFAEKKRKAKAIDFNDMEHLTYELLLDETVAGAYRAKLKHVMFDEYQDCNKLQELIVQRICSDAHYFMVGDVKQSIYQFRAADPSLFIDKYNSSVSQEDAERAKIELNENYRSRANILNATNKIFFDIMKRDVCGMDYTTDNALNAKLDYPDTDFDSFANEPVTLALVDKADLKAELLYVIKEIKTNIIGKKYVFNADGKTYRPIGYGDICVLFHSMSNIQDDIGSMFAQAGIPFVINQKRKINYEPEINVLISLIKAIENPYDDSSLLAVLHSYCFDVTDEELLKIMNAGLTDKRPVIDKVKAYTDAENNPMISVNTELLAKLKHFTSKLSYWIQKQEYLSGEDFLELLLEETAYKSYFGAFENGAKRVKNIEKFCDLLKMQMDSASGGLFDCIPFLEKMDRDGVEIQNGDERVEAVNVMTIHTSKGLEFPVVFVAQAGKGFNISEVNKTVLIHKVFGTASKSMDSEKRIFRTNMTFELLKSLIVKQKREEEQRLLYVAMTRARERLYIVGNVIKKLDEYCGRSIIKTFDAANYLDWITYSLCWDEATPDASANISQFYGKEFTKRVSGTDYKSKWFVDFIETEQKEDDIAIKTAEGALTIADFAPNGAQNPMSDDTDADVAKPSADEELINKLKERASFSYPFAEATKLASKLSVSQIKKLEKEENSEEIKQISVGKITSDEQMTAAKKGTLYHFFLQHMTLKENYSSKDFENDVSRMLEKKLITEFEKQNLKAPKFSAFINSDVGRELVKSENVEREKPFSYLLDASEVYPDVKSNDKILIQGVVDCMFTDENGDYVLIDYKTDNVHVGQEALLVERHKKQIELYKKAISEIEQITFARAYIYSFALEKFIKVE